MLLHKSVHRAVLGGHNGPLPNVAPIRRQPISPHHRSFTFVFAQPNGEAGSSGPTSASKKPRRAQKPETISDSTQVTGQGASQGEIEVQAAAAELAAAFDEATGTNSGTAPDKLSDIEREIAFQEEQADVTVQDILQWNYEMPEDDEDEQLIMEQEASSYRSTQSEETSTSGNSESDTFGTSRKGAILLELLSAGADLDNKLAQFEDDIDDELLALLESRIETSRMVDQYSPLVLRMEEVYRILKIVYQRLQASPAMRLLDDVLDILGDDMDPQVYEQQRMEAMARMRDAFTGGTSGVDIFAAAAALADTQVCMQP